MSFIFKKKSVVGVSLNPESGLEVCQIDFSTGCVLKYGRKPLEYDNITKTITDLDVFKETLQDLLIELEIPKGTEVVLNLPTIAFKIKEYPASLNKEQTKGIIEEELSEMLLFQETEPCISEIYLPNSTIQYNKVAYTAIQKVMLIEIAMQIKELGYKLIGINTSVDSTLNALVYNQRIDTASDKSWVMLFVDNNYCRILLMQGKNYLDSFEEPINIGDVLGEEENISIVLSAIEPIVKNLPSQYLYIVSKTSLISAEKLARKIKYNAPIIHEEDNIYSTESYLPFSPEIEEEIAKNISLDVIGAAIYRDLETLEKSKFNLYNESLGDIYILEQPITVTIKEKTYTLSIENMIVASLIMLAIVSLITLCIIIPINSNIKIKEKEIKNLDLEIRNIQNFLDKNKEVSADVFDEGDEIRIGLIHNKNIYSYYTIVGTEIPKKLWLTGLDFGKNITISGQADNLESIYSFFRNVKDYNPSSNLKLEKLSLATGSNMKTLSDEEAFDTESIISSINSDYYEFTITNEKKNTTEAKVKTNETKKSASKSKKAK